MLTVHHALAFLVIGVCLLATVLALVAYRRRVGAGALVSHVLALAHLGRLDEAAEELRLKPGLEAVATVKATSVMVEVPDR